MLIRCNSEQRSKTGTQTLLFVSVLIPKAARLCAGAALQRQPSSRAVCRSTLKPPLGLFYFGGSGLKVYVPSQ
jgi:hypothetical protein